MGTFFSIMQFLDEVISLIDMSIKEDADNLITTGNIIKDGFDNNIDIDRKTVSESHKWVSEYQRELIGLSNITSLKIKFTNNAGYFIEIPKSQINNIPEFFIGKQTLMQASRYTTIELQNFEKKLFLASSELYEKEYNSYIDIRNTVLGHFSSIYELSRKTSFLDYITNGAYISAKRAYTMAEISGKYEINIQGGKHPVILEKEQDFISNDLLLSSSDFVHIITGPNMGGKSTYLRQNALLVLMAHIGYDIPCKNAEIGLTDKIFSRVGSGDNLYLGQSTFMVEMQEIGYILRNSTKRSFVIIDEIGRGTSTYDGMSLAWSILQHNHDKIKAKTLFATHYHEIIDHANNLKGVNNFSVAVGENDENIVFLRKIIPGGIKKSYGIEVAKLAGIPNEVLNQARKMMGELQVSQNFQQLSLGVETKQDDLADTGMQELSEEIILKIEKMDIDNMSPLESLHILHGIREQVKKRK